MTEQDFKAIILKEIAEIRKFQRLLKDKSSELDLEPEQEILYIAAHAQIKILEKVYQNIK